MSTTNFSSQFLMEKGKPKTLMWIIMIGVVALVVSILGGVLGTRANNTQEDQDCTCRRPTDGGWMGFSIAWFVISVIVLIVLITQAVGKAQGKGGKKSTSGTGIPSYRQTI